METLLSVLAAKLTLSKALALIAIRIEQFATIAFVFIPLERLIPFRPKQRLFRAQFVLDLLHYFVGGIFIIVFVWLTYNVMPFVFGWAGNYVAPLSLRHLPGWAQFVAFEVGWTFLGYWLHRFMHYWPPLWRMHSIHESPPELDWLSAFRLHPLEPALFQFLTIMPLWLLEVSQPVAFAYTIYAYVTAHVQHANIAFPIGPLKYVFPTPGFHRWHHARARNEDGSETLILVNFGQYPIWDILFGTFYLPATRPTEYGNSDGDRIPLVYLAQIAYPFGGHLKVLEWKHAISERFKVSDKFAHIRTAFNSVHEAFENRLATFCLLRTETEPPSAAIATQSALQKEIVK